MAMRLLEIYIGEQDREVVNKLLDEHPITTAWGEEVSKEKIVVKVLVPVEYTDRLLGRLENSLGKTGEYRIMVFPVAATLPRPEVKVEEQAEKGREEEGKEEHISKEELYSEIGETVKVTRVFLLLAILSAVVAAGGLLYESVEFVIGAMVIAPLLGPNVAFGLAMVLGDLKFAWQAVKASTLGYLAAFAVTVTIGIFTTVDMDNPLIVSRTRTDLSSIALALAAGFAASLSYTTALMPALVGVMVAVALLPPLVVFGLLVGNAYWREAGQAFVLVLVNIVCINLAAVSVFILQKIRPRSADQAELARKTSVAAVIFWLLLLGALVVLGTAI